ncbi:rhomboid family intramembrane serine protease [Xanthomonas albilineans]|uniref:rhomboid family intramembrane serine protease n=1 Tax=Xanthomonas albilineans TaxID=29447 RepID=UPI0005F310C3|nr:rhomboid family intramembrane serine protease [Xanthomonas albilineans]
MHGDGRWDDEQGFPDNEQRQWSLFDRRQPKNINLQDAMSLASKWLPANSMLIASPNSTKFLPPILIPELEHVAFKSVQGNYKRISVGLLVFGMLLCVVAFQQVGSRTFHIGLLSVSLAGALILDYCLGIGSKVGLVQRAMFFRWLNVDKRSRQGRLIWMGLILATGCLQLLMIEHLGSNDLVFQRIGAMYASIDSGEYWRFFSGPFLHYSLYHFIKNAVLLLFVGVLSSALLGHISLVVFFFGNIIAAYAQMNYGGHFFDNYGGLSGGVYALFGLVIFSGFTARSLMPKGFCLFLANLAVLGVLEAELMSENAATTAHLAGFFFGLICGLILKLSVVFKRA